MDQRAALLQAILDEPEDDAARLIYADWLEEHGEEDDRNRAELIRVQMELARLPAQDLRRKELERCQEKVLRGRQKAWKEQLPKVKGVRWGEFERGFVGEAIFQSAFMYRQQIGRVVAVAPVWSVRLRVATALRAVSTTRFSARIGSLTIENERELEDKAIEDLLASAHLGRLHTLALRGCGRKDDDLRALARSTGLPKLALLDLTNNRATSAGAAELLAAPHRAGLRLILVGNQVKPEAGGRLRERFGDRIVLGPLGEA